MLIKRAHVPTRNATRYIARICRHFSHKLPASWEDNMGEVTFPTGVCQLEAKEDALALQCESSSGEDLNRICNVIDSHLVRFAVGAKVSEELHVVWEG